MALANPHNVSTFRPRPKPIFQEYIMQRGNLVLSFRKGDKAHINDNIVITVVDVRNDSVTLAFEAPREDKILRGKHYKAPFNEDQNIRTDTIGEQVSGT